MSLLDTLKSAGSITSTVISESQFFKPKTVIQTAIPIINISFTGTLDGGLVPGLTVIAGPSKHFKCLGPNTQIKVYSKEKLDI